MLFIIPPLHRRGGGYTVFLPLSVLPSVLPSFRPSTIFFVAFFSVTVHGRNLIFWSQASYRYPISWEALLDPTDSYFLFADFVDFDTHLKYILYMPIFSHIFLSNYWWQKSDIWSHASDRYPISWEAFFNPSDSYFLFAEERGYHRWALAHSSSCWIFIQKERIFSNLVYSNITTDYC